MKNEILNELKGKGVFVNNYLLNHFVNRDFIEVFFNTNFSDTYFLTNQIALFSHAKHASVNQITI